MYAGFRNSYITRPFVLLKIYEILILNFLYTFFWILTNRDVQYFKNDTVTFPFECEPTLIILKKERKERGRKGKEVGEGGRRRKKGGKRRRKKKKEKK
jgi:hypothetical protein